MSDLRPEPARWSTPESPALRRLAERTRTPDRPGPAPDAAPREGLSGHVEGQVLKMLVHATRAWRVLGIGLSTGYSALAMAEALPPDGRVVACGTDPAAVRLARDCFADSPAGDRIAVEVGPARRTLEALSSAGEVFDLVVIDADRPGHLDHLDAVPDFDPRVEQVVVPLRDGLTLIRPVPTEARR